MRTPNREQLLHSLYEAAELEHDLMCTYLYAAFTLKTDLADGITSQQAERARSWRSSIVQVAIEEMCHLASVWNITSALGGSPRFGRGNFPIETGALPACVVARLAPLDDNVLQHFLYLERPARSAEHDAGTFPHAPVRSRSQPRATLTPMSIDYETVGAFYATLRDELRMFVAAHGEEATFCNDPALQLTSEDLQLFGIQAVSCSTTAFGALTSIVEQGEGASADSANSHFRTFRRIRDELASARRADVHYTAAFPAARDPVLRPPIGAGRTWITDDEAVATVDLANACYGLMLRLLAYAYVVPRGVSHRQAAIDVALGLMRAMTPIAERAVRIPIGVASPGITAGMTFTTLREAAPLPRGASAWRVFDERMDQLVVAATRLATSKDPRIERALRLLLELADRVRRVSPATPAPRTSPTTPFASPRPPGPEPTPSPPVPVASSSKRAPDSITSLPSLVSGGKRSPGKALTVLYDGRRCIHARRCVTSAPKVFAANVTTGPWIHPDEADAEHVCEIIHRCPSGALRYERADGTSEPAPQVNLIEIRERGPYAVRANIELCGEPGGYRLTLCRCGASQNKPFCDNSHRHIGFIATGEPPTMHVDALADRAGVLAIDPTIDGPLEIAGNVEIVSGTGRVVSRVTHAKLCRCGASATKPFCDQSHRRVGFRSS
ncbi:MAG: ferritin-like domain-containing protein [Kofleriaceae bacterium]